ncbi:MAG: hypothetical protein WC979_09040 [Candidatus Pacearchaeota archaeon]|jgi:hypothetical protein
MIEDLMNLRNSTCEITTTVVDGMCAMPTHHNSLKVLKFVNSATSDKKEMREFLEGVLFQDTYAVATDGRRLHIYLGEEFNISKFGAARVSVSKNDTVCKFYDCHFPNFRRVIPEITDATSKVLLSYYKNNGICDFIYPLSKNKFVFNDLYLKELVTYADVWRAYFSENTSAVVFESLDTTLPKVYAVIMPIKVSDA